MSSSDFALGVDTEEPGDHAAGEHDRRADVVPDGQRPGVLARSDQRAEDRRRGHATGELRDGEEEGDGLTAQLEREDLADREVGRRGAGRGEEEDHAPEGRLRHRVEQPWWNRKPEIASRIADTQYVNRIILRRPIVSKRWPISQRAEQVADREREEVVPSRLRGDVVEVGQHQGVGEEDRVVQEGLRHHHREAQERARRVLAEHRLGDLARRRRCRRPVTSIALLVRHRLEMDASRSHARLDLVDDPLGLLFAAVGHQPARALGDRRAAGR